MADVDWPLESSACIKISTGFLLELVVASLEAIGFAELLLDKG